MSRYQLTREDRSKGGKVRSQQASFTETCSKGFWATYDRHPFFARKHLRQIIQTHNARKKSEVK